MAPRASFTSRILVILKDKTGKSKGEKGETTVALLDLGGEVRLVEQSLVLCKSLGRRVSAEISLPRFRPSLPGSAPTGPQGSRQPRAAPGQSSKAQRERPLYRCFSLNQSPPHRVDEGAQRGNAVLPSSL